MKITFLFLLTLFLFLSTKGQNYECIKPLSVQHFLGDSSYPILSIRIDSMILSGDTTSFYNYYMFRPVGQSNNYWTVKGDPWTGKIVFKLTSGMWGFINGNNDTIYINSLAQVNDSWRFCTLSDGSYYQAQIISHNQLQFIGLTDSVKTLSIQKYSPAGQTVSSPNNGLQISISKNYGMIKTLNFDAFEKDNSSYIDDETFYIFNLHTYNLFGMTNPVAGWHSFTAYEIYGANQIGDEIHFTTWYNETFGYNDNTRQNIYRFLNKNIYNNGDSVEYEIERCCLFSNFGPNWGMVNYTFINDTVFYRYNLNNSSLNLLTLEANCNGYGEINTFYKHVAYTRNFANLFWGSCEQSELIMVEGATYINYKPNLWGFNSSGWGYNSESGSDVVYFNISGNEWGNPFFCDSLRLVGVEPNINVHLVKVFPNPFSDYLIVEYNRNIICKKPSFIVYNVIGVVQNINNLNSGINKIDVSNLLPGLYFFNIVIEGEIISGGKIIKQ